MRLRSCRPILLIAAGTFLGAAYAAAPGPQAGLSPDQRPVLMLQPPHGPLLLVRRAADLPQSDRRRSLPAAWRTNEPDRGFGQALLMQLSQASANWPWRTLIVSSSGPESDSQLQSLMGQDAVIAAVDDELVDLKGRVQLQVTMRLVTVRAIATTHETRVRTRVDYLAAPLTGNSARPRRSRAHFVRDGALDEQVSTAATDLSHFLATIVARVSVPESLHPHNPSLGELGLHPVCGVCRASDPVVYEQPGRVWVGIGKLPGTILALPLTTRRPISHGPRTDRAPTGP
ncbi:MAG TPA: hypothetical protein VMF03_04495 [Steroidobacteraceae bacterium]|nr:hypothetical protein [Steroidobacteraceae bacterium]